MSIHRLSGVHMESQTAYELACEGLIRPSNSKLPVIYGIKCVHFSPPNFTLGKYFFPVFEVTKAIYNTVSFKWAG